MSSPNFTSPRSSERSSDGISELDDIDHPSKRNIAMNVMYRNNNGEESYSPELQDDDVYYNKQ